MYTPVNPSFTIQKWGLRGSKLYRRVFVMATANRQDDLDRYSTKKVINCTRKCITIFISPRKYVVGIYEKFNVYPQRMSPRQNKTDVYLNTPFMCLVK